MNPVLEHLIVLQAQDLDLERLRKALQDAPLRVARAEVAWRLAETALGAVRGKLAAEEKLRRGQELEIASLRTKLERLRRSLDGATSAAQVSAFEREIGFAQEAASGLEEAAFASLERTEALEGELRHCEREAGEAEGKLEQVRAEAERTGVSNRMAVEGLERERAGLRSEIEPGALGSYDRLRKTRGTAVAEALGNATVGKCGACQMGVRPQRWQNLIGREHEAEIFTCESCGRMLFWDPRRDTPKPWATGDRFQAAQAAMAASGTGEATEVPKTAGGSR